MEIDYSSTVDTRLPECAKMAKEGRLQEAVESLLSLEIQTRTAFILEQMRLCIAVKDYICSQIISKKINTKFFTEDGTEESKLKCYNLMIQVDPDEGSYLSMCKHYCAIYDTPCILEDSSKWQQALKSVVLYVILAPYDNEQLDLVHRINEDNKLEEIPKYKDLLKQFTTMELMRWASLVEDYGEELREGSTATDVFNFSEEGEKRWKDLKNRVVEHNIRIMAKYYTRITMKRMAGLLDLSNLVVNKTIYAKVDRLAGIINFQRPKDPNGPAQRLVPQTELPHVPGQQNHTSHRQREDDTQPAVMRTECIVFIKKSNVLLNLY
ncbi:unnamed protein product [Oncorhynchus mykiss]|uniref:PCI domain-containing protein n=1 Tax=Oncorhynchus mykiss TaxID=8022 RepID=A0A060Y341_ONCMY|nr:unnamed protein product [Oncorhynchus mykiss]